jgi:hypothetical protein
MMTSIRDIHLKADLLFCTFLSVLALPPGRVSAQGPANVVLWDTGTHFSDAVEVNDRGAWKAIPTDLLTFEANPPKASSDPGYYGLDYAFRGDAVVENQKVLAVFWAAKGSLVLYSKAASGTAGLQRILELNPVQSSGSSADLVLVRNAADEAAVQLVFHDPSKSALTVAFDRTEVVTVRPDANLTRFTIRARFEYGVIPGFVGDDLIYGPQEKGMSDRLEVPSENFLLALLQGEGAEFVMTWPKGKQKVRLGLAQETNSRRPIESLEFENDGQSFYLAPLAAPGIWHKETLSATNLEKDVAIAWKKPFPARWKTQLFEEAGKTTFVFRATKGDVWRGVAGSYNYPVWFEDDQAFYHLSKKVPPKGESLIYFLEGQGTPPAIATPADILKSSLGLSMADSILDIAGRKLRTHHRRGGEGVHRACTCGCTEAIQAVFEAHEEVERKADIKGDLEDMVYFVHAHVDRINEYRRFADELLRDLDSRKAAAPELGEYIDTLEPIVRQIPQECGVQQENMKSFAYADELVRRTLALTEKNDPNNVKAYMELLKDWRAMGGAQDYVVAQCHIITRKVEQEAGYGCASQPKAVALAEEIRARARHCLRNPDGYEIWADY